MVWQGNTAAQIKGREGGRASPLAGKPGSATASWPGRRMTTGRAARRSNTCSNRRSSLGRPEVVCRDPVAPHVHGRRVHARPAQCRKQYIPGRGASAARNSLWVVPQSTRRGGALPAPPASCPQQAVPQHAAHAQTTTKPGQQAVPEKYISPPGANTRYASRSTAALSGDRLI